MSIDDGVDEDEAEIDLARWNEERILQMISLAKREYPDKVCPLDKEDFFDIHRNGSGYITQINEPHCGRYFRHHMVCMDQEFSCVTDEDMGLVF